MAELLQEYTTKLEDEEGRTYSVRSYGEQREDGTWAAWLEFSRIDNPTIILRTNQETSQPNRVTAFYWASGLEPIYFEGAFARARPA